ncbi:response regulator transcription factor [Sphaerisporangium corydalis]|uniref:Response regulator n=1 Tax=Sphaerisporangium corydalis TaxID=1441875 RepID=A0ABV9ETL3_9ACTN|nr:response regulator transcription factor [Sphaerisporangium corydalis]
MHADRVALRVVLAEDFVLLRAGLVHLLERFGYEVVAQVGEAPSLLSAVRAYRPDLVVTDVRMPPGNTDDGLRAANELRRERPGLPVLVLSQYIEQTYAAELLQGDPAGIGYLLKDRVTNVADFATALRQVAAGGTVIDPAVVSQLLARHRDRSPVATLTPREREVLELMAQGRTNAAIARALFLSEQAIAKHIGGIFGRLGLAPATDDNRRVLAVLAYLRAPR